MSPITTAERQAIAVAVGLHEQYLYQCLTRRRVLPVEHAPGIERASQGRATCEGLRPDVLWVRVPDPAWPHPAGRPCIDVAGPSPGQNQESNHEQ